VRPSLCLFYEQSELCLHCRNADQQYQLSHCAYPQATDCYKDTFCSSCEYHSNVAPRINFVRQQNSDRCNTKYENGVTTYPTPEKQFRVTLAGSMRSDACAAAAADTTSVLGKYLTCQSQAAITACAVKQGVNQCYSKVTTH
jgi:hypothetical protein